MVWGVPVACDRRTREIGHIFPDRRLQPARNAKSVKLLTSVSARHFTGRSDVSVLSDNGQREHLLLIPQFCPHRPGTVVERQ